ncbi:hypothetical protein MML48_9g00007544 [Holotrichia oblita]|uniref:Uncharacterized protein n=1 Tax=Holotrichia oblita TaxID=644536 RepID=A0ACB9SL49_HOLOL|nr:hypothetical protein MML48_9g00007544 [Holotrichia oblita]
MPKIVQGEKYYKKYTENDIQKALEEIKIGKPLRVVSRQCKIARATLQFRKSQNYVKPTFGPNPILSNDEEKILVNWIFENYKRGFPRRKDDVQESVKEFLDQRPRQNPFVNNCPGETWYLAFRRRNPEVTERTSEAVTAASANVSEEILDDPTRVMNADETCFHLCPKNNKVLAPRGARNVYEVEHASSKATLIVMFTFTASGQVTPPMIVYPYKTLPTNIAKFVPPGWGIGLSDTGWMKMDVMSDYIENILHPYLKNIGTIFPVILFLNGHCTHLSYKLSSLCVKLQIILVCLYPNATRIMQPADVAAFKPIKNGWKKAVVEWRRTHPLETLTKEHFAPVLKLAVERSAKIETIKNGFRASGLNPWNPDAIDFSKCLGGQYKAPHSTSKNNDGTYLSYKNFANIVGSELLDEFTLREQEYAYKLWKNFTPLKEESNEVVKYSKSTQPLTENVIIEELKEIPTNEKNETTTVNQIDTVDPPISQTDTQVTMWRTENQECLKKDSETGVKTSETVPDCSISLDKTLWYAKTPIRKGVIWDIMPRTYKRRLGAPLRQDYSAEDVERALLDVVEKGFSFRQAAERNNMPKSTIDRKYRGANTSQLGRPPVLSQQEERKIVSAITSKLNESVPLIKRKKKIDVAPGKSVSTKDLEIPILRQIEEREESDTENESDVDDPITHVVAAELQVEMFIIVNFIYDRNTKKETNKKFVAQIKNVNGPDYVVKCMRESAKSKGCNIFFPVSGLLALGLGWQLPFVG